MSDDVTDNDEETPGPVLSPQDPEVREDSLVHGEADAATEYETLAHGFLSPRHRRLAQLAAEGLSNSAIGEALGYSGSRVSILLKNPHIALEIRRLQDRIFEETIQQRLKSFADPALNNVQMILTDKTNRVKISEKADMSKWVIEKLDGKAVQKHDVGENMLSLLLDRLDAQKSQPLRDVLPAGSSPHDVIETEVKRIEAEAKPRDEMSDWIAEFCGESEP